MNLDILRKRIKDDYETLLKEISSKRAGAEAPRVLLINVISGVLNYNERKCVLNKFDELLISRKNDINRASEAVKQVRIDYYNHDNLIYGLVQIAFDLKYNGCRNEEDIIVLNRIVFLLCCEVFN